MAIEEAGSTHPTRMNFCFTNYFFTGLEKTIWLSCYDELLLYSYRRTTTTVRKHKMEVFFVT